MRSSRLLCLGAVITAAGVLGSRPMTVEAGPVAAAAVPVLLAKSWFVGYALVFLAILLGLLAVLIPSMRKSLRKKGP
ncbi:MAG: hypothetical protein ACODAD_12490 [Planctomycetota bacterium]